jgi:hypothetical protein
MAGYPNGNTYRGFGSNYPIGKLPVRKAVPSFVPQGSATPIMPKLNIGPSAINIGPQDLKFGPQIDFTNGISGKDFNNYQPNNPFGSNTGNLPPSTFGVAPYAPAGVAGPPVPMTNSVRRLPSTVTPRVSNSVPANYMQDGGILKPERASAYRGAGQDNALVNNVMDGFNIDVYNSKFTFKPANVPAPAMDLNKRASRTAHLNYGTTDPALNDGSIGSSIMDGVKTAWGSFKDALPDIGGKDSMFNSESMFGEKGWVAPTLQGLGSLASGWAAVGQYGVAKDSLAMQQDAFNKNYVAQGRLTNAQLADQQTRNLGNMSPERQAQALTADDYVKKYGVANV